MRWTTDAALLRLLARIPLGPEVHYQLQRRVTGGFPIDDQRLAREERYANLHLSTIDSSRGARRLRAVEFGAGRHLSVAMLLGAANLDVLATDVSPLVKLELVRDAARRFDRNELRSVAASPDVIGALTDLGVRYQVMPPSLFDGVPDRSIDLVYSTSVIEHVPTEQLSSLLREIRRVLALDGVVSLIVDYKDHYSYGGDVSEWNFLTVPADSWFSKYSPPNHFQNRIRHSQLVELLEAEGFLVEVASCVEPTAEDLEWLRVAELDDEFRGLDLSDVGIREAHLVCALQG